ncbi:MAG: MBOAT family protein [Planctomycetota bacterium]
MSFNSLVFLIFLPIVYLLYLALNRKWEWQNLLLVAASQYFYGWWDWRFLSLLWASSILDFSVGLALEGTLNPRMRRLYLALSLGGNLGILALFKYYDFFIGSARNLAHSLGMTCNLETLDLILPMGISFYTFQTLSYSLDVYKRAMPACRRFTDFLLFVSYFPQLVAGPIEKARDLLPQLQARRQPTVEQFSDGARLMLWGYFKKIVVADNLAPYVGSAFENPAAGGGHLIMASLAFSFQLYGDFSGYSDIARGISRMFGIELTRNFERPFFSPNLVEFWRRWHVTLTGWFREFVYIPLGGNKRGPTRARLNLLATFLCSGLWHGANWTFVVWGLFNGLICAFSKRRLRMSGSFRALAGALITTGLFSVSMVFFRAHDMAHGWAIFSSMGHFLVNPQVTMDPALATLILWVALMLAAEYFQGRRDHPMAIAHLPAPSRWTLEYGLLMVCVIWGQFTAPATFIYFQF